MARRAITKGSGKGRAQLNATLPKQLVLDFNATASLHGVGSRDTLLKEVLLSFLASANPASKSVCDQQEQEQGAFMRRRDAVALESVASEREAIRISRECAEKILEVTRNVRRKAPKKAEPLAGKRNQKVS